MVLLTPLGGGQVKNAGTSYQIAKGKSLIGGASKDINFVTYTLTITGNGYDADQFSSDTEKYASYIMIGSTKIESATTLTVNLGTTIKIYGKGGRYSDFSYSVACKLNGTVVGTKSSGYTTYSLIHTYTVDSVNTTIRLVSDHGYQTSGTAYVSITSS